MKDRVKRVSELLKETIAEIILKEFDNPHLGFITITAVKMTKDLKKATVYFTCYGNEEKELKAKKILNDSKGYIKERLSNKIVLKYMPDLKFELDEELKRQNRIDKLLRELKKDERDSISE
ncbi:MAG: 30S ribosome-binding factor RbfA [candidate division WOR-3 bacterium]|nr:30S ribosome-binding factor RbfA [candidate division WOR-3 bacterium]MCX7837124.1 30S ribosome-binding factor RbfA [candidate division WOR-3 bacterium]MDW8113667.1 30S ribosome-binding factor RbfA [candidate division WOR-3 bacterium]